MDLGLFGTRDEKVMSVTSVTPPGGGVGSVSNIGVREEDDFFQPSSMSHQASTMNAAQTLSFQTANSSSMNTPPPSNLKRKLPPATPKKQLTFKQPISSFQSIPNRKDLQQNRKRKHSRDDDDDDDDDFEDRMNKRRSSSSTSSRRMPEPPSSSLKMSDLSVFAGAEDGKDPIVDAAQKQQKQSKQRSHEMDDDDSDSGSGSGSDSGSDSESDDDDDDRKHFKGDLPPSKRGKVDPQSSNKDTKAQAVNQAFLPFHQASFAASSEARQKAMLKARIKRRDKSWGKFTKIPDDATVQQLIDIDAEAEYEQEAELSVDMYRNSLSGGTKIIEDIAVARGVNDLEGWNEDFQLTAGKLDPILYKLHERHPFPAHPLMQLTMALGSHATQFMSMKKKMREMATQAQQQQPRLVQAAIQQPSSNDLFAINIDPPRSFSSPQSQPSQPTERLNVIDGNRSIDIKASDLKIVDRLETQPTVDPRFVLTDRKHTDTTDHKSALNNILARTKTVELGGPRQKTSTSNKKTNNPPPSLLIVNKAAPTNKS